MRRVALLATVLILLMSACGSDEAEEAAAASSTSTSTVPTTAPSTTVPVTTTTAIASTTTVATTTTTTTVAPTTTAVPITVAEIEARVAAEWPGTVAAGMWSEPDAWTCRQITPGAPGVGTALACVPVDTSEGQHPVLTVLVVDSSGATAIAQAGVVYDVLNADAIVELLGAGGFCRDILADDSYLTELPDPELVYFGAVLYWFIEAMPERMDADHNQIPCETLVPASVVTSVWDGGWVEG